MNMTDCGFNSRFMKSELLKNELILVFLLYKYKLALPSTVMEVYDNDAVLLTWIMHGSPPDVGEAIYSTVLQCMYQENDSFMNMRSMKLVLILPSLIVGIYFEHGVVTVPSNIMAHHIEPLSDTIVQNSLNTRPK